MPDPRIAFIKLNTDNANPAFPVPLNQIFYFSDPVTQSQTLKCWPDAKNIVIMRNLYPSSWAPFPSLTSIIGTSSSIFFFSESSPIFASLLSVNSFRRNLRTSQNFGQKKFSAKSQNLNKLRSNCW